MDDRDRTTTNVAVNFVENRRFHHRNNNNRTMAVVNNNRGGDMVTLQTPRPRNLRNCNDYFEVNQSSNCKNNGLTNLPSTSNDSSTLQTTTNSTTNYYNNVPPTNKPPPSITRPSYGSDLFYHNSVNYNINNNNNRINNLERVKVHAKVQQSLSPPSVSLLLPQEKKKNNVIISPQQQQNNNNNNVRIILHRRPTSPDRTTTKKKFDDENNKFSVITSQPKKSTTTNSNSSSLLLVKKETVDSCRPKQRTKSPNLCPRCNKCRCSDCKIKKPIPSKWICNNLFLCSVDNTVDLLSGMCCIKGCLYHTLGGDNEVCLSSSTKKDNYSSTNDNDQQQQQQRQRHNNNINNSNSNTNNHLKSRNNNRKKICSSNCCLRYSLVGATATVLMPCLICYLPLKCCGKLASTLYGNCHDYGCRCDQRTTSDGSCSGNSRTVGAAGRRLTNFNNDDEEE